jgi:dTDP-glucose pyrophosphorylase
MNKKPALLVLAAGIGSRYGGLKQMDQVGPCGEAIMDYSIYDAIRAGIEKIVFVIREEMYKDFHEVIGSRLERRVMIDYAFQELSMIPEGFVCPPDRKKPWGTGHAILIAREKIDEPFIVINADDFYGAGSYDTIARFLENSSDNEYAMVGFKLENTLSDYGQVARGVCKTDQDSYLESIVELTNIEKDNQKIFYTGQGGKRIPLSGNEDVSMNIWGFHPNVFDFLRESFSRFLHQESSNPKSEHYIPTLIHELLEAKKATVKVLHSTDSWFGVTYREDKPMVVNKIRELINQGVYPESLYKK